MAFQRLLGLGRAGLVFGMLASPMLVPASASAAQTVVISAGAESTGGDVQLNLFAPNETTLNVGDTLTWSLDSTEFHNVYFPNGGKSPEFISPGPDGVAINPQVAMPSGSATFDGSAPAGSGLLDKGQTYSLTFTKAGQYPYLCSIHTGMGGVVNVVDPGKPADTQAAIDARRTAQVQTQLATKALPLVISNGGELKTEGASAGIAAGVQVGPVDVQRFFPQRVTVTAGDAITWIWKTDETPHTVTFLAGQPAPEVVVPVMQTAGPPTLTLNPAILAPAGDANAWEGGTYLNSGFLEPTPGAMSPTFTVRFANPGTYEYVCVLHDGMVGTIVVE